MTYRTLGVLAAALLALGSATAARADTLAQVRLERFGYRLVDLRPEDGIAPALRWIVSDGGLGGSSVLASVQDDTPPYRPHAGSSRRDQLQLFARMGAEARLPIGQATSRLSGSFAEGVFDYRVFSRSAVLADAGTGHDRRAYAQTRPTTNLRTSFEVTPFTLVLFSGRANLRIEREMTDAAHREYTSAELAIDYRTAPDGSGRQRISLNLGTDPFGIDRGLSRRRSTDLAFSFTNDSATVGRSHFHVEALTDTGLRLPPPPGRLGLAPAAPVPEASTLALMLCGLGGVAGAVRRRPGRPARQR